MWYRSKKSLGQNFLIDQNILKKIAKIGKISKNDNILEIGPGTGNLTKYIVEYKPKSTVVVEKDSNLIKILKSKFNNQISIIHNDVLNLPENFYKQTYIVYGNLPYNISSQILAKWCLNKKIKFKKMILMFQKEVADRILAKVNCKDYSRLTILANWRFEVKKKFNVNPECFSPRPKIMSTLLEFIPKKNVVELNEPSILENITRLFFSQRRKMVKKNFAKFFNNFDYVSKKIGISLNDRPQNISINKYIQLAKEYEDKLS